MTTSALFSLATNIMLNITELMENILRLGNYCKHLNLGGLLLEDRIWLLPIYQEMGPHRFGSESLPGRAT